MEPAYGVAAGESVRNRRAMVAHRSVITVARPISVTRSPTVSRTSVEARMAVVAVIPRARADEDAAHKPTRAVITVRSASIRSITVITVSANRRGSNAHSNRSYANTYGHLRLRTACDREKQNCQKRKVF
jgi:hypothetical protein